MGVLSELKPQSVFSYFERLCSVPHGSGNTKIISDLCVEMAKELGLRCRQDELNNVIIWKDGSRGYENAEPVILQGHMDMVCVKTKDSAKDMAKEGLDLCTDGQWIWADKTSLGGDDCIAVAVAFAVLADDTLAHPPLEVVLTVDEETGMDGAFGIDCSDLKGRMFLNLDSEEEGVFTVSCAGGARALCLLPGHPEPADSDTFFEVTLCGLQGGHSGAEIDKGRANANQLMGRVLYTAMQRLDTLRLADIRGGQFENVICPRNDAVVGVPAAKAEAFEAFITAFAAVLKNEYRGCDDGLQLTCRRVEARPALSVKTTHRVLTALLVVPQGVEAMNVDFPGLVQTSLNMGVMHMDGEGVHFTLSVRSCIASQKEMLLQRIGAIIELAGGTVEPGNDYPGWQYARESVLRDRVMAAYRAVTGKEGRIEATHGGLECGLFIEKMPWLDAVSLGPEMHDIHSERERLSVPSTAQLYEVVCRVLEMSK